MKGRGGKENKEKKLKSIKTHIYIYEWERDIYDHTAIGGTILHKDYFFVVFAYASLSIKTGVSFCIPIPSPT